MKFREKLADWLTGGDYGKYKSGEHFASAYIRAKQNEGIYLNAIKAIHAYTATQKSGTARKVTRMCEGALK